LSKQITFVPLLPPTESRDTNAKVSVSQEYVPIELNLSRKTDRRTESEIETKICLLDKQKILKTSFVNFRSLLLRRRVETGIHANDTSTEQLTRKISASNFFATFFFSILNLKIGFSMSHALTKISCDS
jgi:hypothetical protein